MKSPDSQNPSSPSSISPSYSAFGKGSPLSQRKKLNTSYDYYYSVGNSRKRTSPSSMPKSFTPNDTSFSKTKSDGYVREKQLHPGGNLPSEAKSNLLFHGSMERRNSASISASDRRESKQLMLQKNIGLTNAIIRSSEQQYNMEDQKNAHENDFYNNRRKDENKSLEKRIYDKDTRKEEASYYTDSIRPKDESNSDFSLSNFLAGGNGTNSRRNSKIVISSNKPHGDSNENLTKAKVQSPQETKHLLGRRNSSNIIMGMLNAFKTKRNSNSSFDSSPPYENSPKRNMNDFYPNQEISDDVKNLSYKTARWTTKQKEIWSEEDEKAHKDMNHFWTIISQDIDSKTEHCFFSSPATNLLPNTLRTVYPGEESSIVIRYYSPTNLSLNGSLDVNFWLYQNEELKNCHRLNDMEPDKLFSYTITQLNKTTFRISYKVKAVGQWRIEVLFNNHPIKPRISEKSNQSSKINEDNISDYPLNNFAIVNVIPNPTAKPFPTSTLVKGDGIKRFNSHSSNLSTFSIVATDEFGNYLQLGGHDVDVNIHCSSKITGQIIDDGSGTYHVNYKSLHNVLTRNTITTSLLEETDLDIDSGENTTTAEPSATCIYLNNLPLIRRRSGLMIFRSLTGVTLTDPDNIQYAQWKIGLFTVTGSTLSISQIMPIEIKEGIGHTIDLTRLYSENSLHITKDVKDQNNLMKTSNTNEVSNYSLVGGSIDRSVLLSVENLVLPNYIQNPYSISAFKKGQGNNYLTLKKHKSNNFLPVFNISLEASSIMFQCLTPSHIICEQWLRVLDICVDQFYQETMEVKRLKLPKKYTEKDNLDNTHTSKDSVNLLDISIKVEDSVIQSNAFTPIVLNDPTDTFTSQTGSSKNEMSSKTFPSSFSQSTNNQVISNLIIDEEQQKYKNEEVDNTKNNNNFSPDLEDNASFDQFEQEIIAYEQKMNIQNNQFEEEIMAYEEKVSSQNHLNFPDNLKQNKMNTDSDRKIINEDDSKWIHQAQIQDKSKRRDLAYNDFEISYLRSLTIPLFCTIPNIEAECKRLEREHQKRVDDEKSKKNYLTEKQLILRDKLREKKLKDSIDKLYKERELAIRDSQPICYATIYKKSKLSPTWHKRFAVLLMSERLSRLVYFIKPFVKQLKSIEIDELTDDEDLRISKQKAFVYEAEERAKGTILLLGCTLTIASNDIITKVDGCQRTIRPFVLHHPNGNKFEFATVNEEVAKRWVTEIEKVTTSNEEVFSESDSNKTEESIVGSAEKKKFKKEVNESSQSSASSTPKKKINIRPTIVRKKVRIDQTDSESESPSKDRKRNLTRKTTTKARIRSSMIRIQNRRKVSSSDESSSSKSSESTKSSSSANNSVDSISSALRDNSDQKIRSTKIARKKYTTSSGSDCSSSKSLDTFQKKDDNAIEVKVRKTFVEDKTVTNDSKETKNFTMSSGRESHQHHRDISSISLVEDEMFLGEGIRNNVNEHSTETSKIKDQSKTAHHIELHKVDLNEKIPVRRKSQQSLDITVNKEGKITDNEQLTKKNQISEKSSSSSNKGDNMGSLLNLPNSLQTAKIIPLPNTPEFVFVMNSSKSKDQAKLKSVEGSLLTDANKLKRHKSSMTKYMSCLNKAIKRQAAALCTCLLHLREQMQAECNDSEMSDPNEDSTEKNYCPQYLYWIEKIDILATSGPDSWTNGWKHLYQLFKTSKFVEKEVICDMFDRYEVLVRQQEICNIEQEALDSALEDLEIQSSEEEIFVKDRDKLSSHNKTKSILDRKGLNDTPHKIENSSYMSVIPPPSNLEMLSSTLMQDLNSLVETSNEQNVTLTPSNHHEKRMVKSNTKANLKKPVTPRVPSHIVPKSDRKTLLSSKPLKRPEWKRLTAKDKPLSPTPRYQVVDMLEREKIEKEKNIPRTMVKSQSPLGLKNYTIQQNWMAPNSQTRSPRDENSFKRRLEYHKNMQNSLVSEGSPTSNKFGNMSTFASRNSDKKCNLSKATNVEGTVKSKLKTEGQYGNIYSALLNNLDQNKDTVVSSQRNEAPPSDDLFTSAGASSKIKGIDQIRETGPLEEVQENSKKVYSVAELLNRAKEKEKSEKNRQSIKGSQTSTDSGAKSMSHPIENISVDLSTALGRNINPENTFADSHTDISDQILNNTCYLSPEEDDITNNEDSYITNNHVSRVVNMHKRNHKTKEEISITRTKTHESNHAQSLQTQKRSPKKNSPNKANTKKLNTDARNKPYPNYLQASFMQSVLGKSSNSSSQDRMLNYKQRTFNNGANSTSPLSYRLNEDPLIDFANGFTTPKTSPSRKEYGLKWQQAFKKGKSPGNGPSFFDLYPTLRSKGIQGGIDDNSLSKVSDLNRSSKGLKDNISNAQIREASSFEFGHGKNKDLLDSALSASSYSMAVGQKVGLAEAAEWQRLVSWLCGLGMERYIKAFADQGLTRLSSLELLNQSDLREIGVDEGDASRLMTAIHIFSQRTREYTNSAMILSINKISHTSEIPQQNLTTSHEFSHSSCQEKMKNYNNSYIPAENAPVPPPPPPGSPPSYPPPVLLRNKGESENKNHLGNSQIPRAVISGLAPLPPYIHTPSTISTILSAFDRWAGEEVLYHWKVLLPKEVFIDIPSHPAYNVVLGLEFYLRLYAAISPILRAGQDNLLLNINSNELKKSMLLFRQYVEDAESLPNINQIESYKKYRDIYQSDNPHLDKKFAVLFQASWTKALRERLSLFLDVLKPINTSSTYNGSKNLHIK